MDRSRLPRPAEEAIQVGATLGSNVSRKLAVLVRRISAAV